MRDGSGNLLGAIKWRASKHGGTGWITGGCASRDAGKTRLMCWADVQQAYVKNVSEVDWQPCVRPGHAPAGLFSFIGGVDGGYHGAWGGTSVTRAYLAIKDRVIRSDDGGLNWADTSITGVDVFGNNASRMYSATFGASDPVNQDFYVIGVRDGGTRMTTDGGTTNVEPAWIPRPTGENYTCYAVEEGGAQVSGRAARWAAAPSDIGIYLTTDGGATGSQISSAIKRVTDMIWRNGTLYVVSAEPTVALHSWTAAGGWFTHTNLPVNDGELQFIVADPRYANAYWLQWKNGAVSWSQDIPSSANAASYVNWVNANGTGYLKVCVTQQTKPRTRPGMARIYMDGGGSWAVSKWFLDSTRINYCIGYGVLRTVIADFPLLGASSSHTHYNARWPNWEEDVGGIEELVGMSAHFAGPNLYLGSQDHILFKDNKRGDGHKDVSYKYYSPALSNCTGIAHGVDPNFVAVCAYKNGPNVGYTTTGKIPVKCANQPAVANPSCGGGIACGAPGQILVFPSLQSQPQYTDDYGATAWKNVRFFLEDNTEILLGQHWTDQHGFHGAAYYNNHHNVCLDPATGALYAVNIGATSTVGGNFVFDNLGWGGLYRCLPSEFPNFKRVIAGQLCPWGNYSLYTCRLIADGQGHLVFMTNPLSNTPNNTTNRSVAIDLATMTKRVITTPADWYGVAFGAPYPGDTQKALWILGWHGGVYGLWLSRDVGLTVHNATSFNITQVAGGALNGLDASWEQFGYLAAGVSPGRGHAIGEYVMELS